MSMKGFDFLDLYLVVGLKKDMCHCNVLLLRERKRENEQRQVAFPSRKLTMSVAFLDGEKRMGHVSSYDEVRWAYECTERGG
jgi:hypothetical protein